MRMLRFYCPEVHSVEVEQTLSKEASHHLLQVLRVTLGHRLSVFDGKGQAYQAELVAIKKKYAVLRIHALESSPPPSPVHTHLGQSVIKGACMDYALQKAVECGVSEITPLITQYALRLDAKRLAKKAAHWHQVIVHACQQCGRSDVPILHPAVRLDVWVQADQEAAAPHASLVCVQSGLMPHAQAWSFKDCRSVKYWRLCIGPEGGFTDDELAGLQHYGFLPWALGPRSRGC